MEKKFGGRAGQIDRPQPTDPPEDPTYVGQGQKTSDVQPPSRPGNEAWGDLDDDISTREAIELHLAGLEYPATKPDVIQYIRWQKAPLEALYLLERLPEQEFGGAEDISQALLQIES